MGFTPSTSRSIFMAKPTSPYDQLNITSPKSLRGGQWYEMDDERVTQMHKVKALKADRNATVLLFSKARVGELTVSGPLSRVRLYGCSVQTIYFLCFSDKINTPSPDVIPSFIKLEEGL